MDHLGMNHNRPFHGESMTDEDATLKGDEEVKEGEKSGGRNE